MLYEQWAVTHHTLGALTCLPLLMLCIILYRYNTTYSITNTSITAQEEEETMSIPSQNLDYINVNNKIIHQETKTQ